MAEVECPTCGEDVEVPDVSGHYTCPHCEVDFEFISEDSTRVDGEFGTINPIVYVVVLMLIEAILYFGQILVVSSFLQRWLFIFHWSSSYRPVGLLDSDLLLF